MSRLRESISQLPAWPGFLVAALLAIGLTGWYYGTTYARCTALKKDRELLREAIVAASSAPDAIVNMALLFPGDWDEVRIAQGHKLAPDVRPYDCPFGWDFSAQERKELVERGDYTLIGFFRGDIFRQYIEFRADWARFEGGETMFAKDAARFRVESPATPSSPYRLVPHQ